MGVSAGQPLLTRPSKADVKRKICAETDQAGGTLQRPPSVEVSDLEELFFQNSREGVFLPLRFIWAN